MVRMFEQREKAKASVEAIEFQLEGATIRGTFYRPEGLLGQLPTVVLANGWSMVTGGDLDDYAAVIVNRGFAALTFDFRGLGKSGGEPRQEIDPYKQIEDYRGAISYVRSRPDVDPERIGIWGTSYAGGHALSVAALDRRVKCVVSQVPTISGFKAAQRRVSPDKAKVLRASFEADREARFRAEPPARLQIISADPNASVAYPGLDSFEYMGSEGERSPWWKNEVTLRSLELARSYEPGAYISRISPTPLLMIVALDDGLTPADLQQEAYSQAHDPKKLILLPGGHYSVYREHFETTSDAAASWFAEHL
ncbi:alpha/beta fold hydrolase [Pseudomonas sp. REB1044]